MARYGVPIVVACVYLVAASWIVGNEGQSYRDSLRRARLAANPAPPPPVASPPAEGPREDVALPTVVAAKAPPEPLKPKAPSPSVPPIATLTSPAIPKTIAPPPKPVAPVAADRLAAWKKDPFWSRPELTRRWDLDKLTLADEKELGEQLNQLILGLNPEDSGPGRKRVQDAAEPFLDQLENKDHTYRFFVLNSEVANAFSHPGGYVYVTRKLLEMIPEDEVAPLEFVVGHEIAHVELQHALACLSARDVRQFSDGTLPKLYFLIIPNGFPEELEFQADAWAYHRMKRRLRSEHDCRQFLRLLDSYARDHKFVNGRVRLPAFRAERLADARDGGTFSPIENHLRSHPAAFDRLDRLKELAGSRAVPARLAP